jgi:hypothetical protein
MLLHRNVTSGIEIQTVVAEQFLLQTNAMDKCPQVAKWGSM